MKRTLHILYQSVPNISGSSTRSKNLIDAQRKLGLNPVVITSPFQKGEDKNRDEIDGVSYYRTQIVGARNISVSEQKKSFLTKILKGVSFLYFAIKVINLVRKEKIDIIHSHATFYCAFAGIIAGGVCRKPTIYEVRSLWYERRPAKTILNRIEKGLYKKLEQLSIACSKKIVCINKNLKEHLMKQLFIKEDKISVVSNAVDVRWLESLPLKKRNSNSLRFGYVGSISPIEGLELTIEAFKNDTTLKNHPFYVYGGGPNQYISKLKTQASANFKFLGQIKKEFIWKAYNSIDVIVIPRPPSLITNTVTPLKPLEGVGAGKIVVVSDIPPMHELIEDQKTGFFFKSTSYNDLVDTLKKIISKYSEISEYEKQVKGSKKTVLEKYSWLNNALQYKRLYETI